MTNRMISKVNWVLFKEKIITKGTFGVIRQSLENKFLYKVMMLKESVS